MKTSSRLAALALALGSCGLAVTAQAQAQGPAPELQNIKVGPRLVCEILQAAAMDSKYDAIGETGVSFADDTKSTSIDVSLDPAHPDAGVNSDLVEGFIEYQTTQGPTKISVTLFHNFIRNIDLQTGASRASSYFAFASRSDNKDVRAEISDGKTATSVVCRTAAGVEK